MRDSSRTSEIDSRETYSMNPDWRVHVGDPEDASRPDFDDAEWERVSLPHAWNEDEAFREDIYGLSTGVAWYRKTFTLPAGAADTKTFVEFEGVRQAAEVYCNGEFVGRHENGVMAFGFDLSDLVEPGENVLAVRVDNDWEYEEASTGEPYQWADHNFNANYGGITKNVKLHVTDRLYQTLPLYSWLGTTGVYVYAEDIDVDAGTATINAESEVRNEHAGERTIGYEVEVRDPDGDTVAEFDGNERSVPPGATVTMDASATVTDLEFWSWGYGYLYDVETRLTVDGEVVDSVTTQTGFRKTNFENGRIELNDRTIQLKGYAQRTTNEWPAIGTSIPAWLSDFSNGQMVAGNANAVRWMHITPWKQDVESCDRMGLIQILPAGDAESDVEGRQWEQRAELMRDAIVYNRNNPSVLFYEGGNEEISPAHMRELLALRDQFDPHGGRAMGSREMLDSDVAEWGGEMLYVNKSADKPLFATEYNRGEGLRRYWDEHSPPYHEDGSGEGESAWYNQNQDSFAVDAAERWYEYWRERPGTGRRVNAGGMSIIFSDSNTHYRGAENYRRSGEVDPMRIPKDAFRAHRAIWDGWVDIEEAHATILGHWNYEPDTIKDVTVVSSADSVELFRNGDSLGYGERSDRFVFTFEDVEWESGELRAVGYGEAGEQVCEDVRKTAGEPTAIELTPITAPTGWRADGHDLALVEVEVVDAEGQRSPIAFDEIEFELDGPAEWRGGIAKGPENYVLSTELPVELGVNRVQIRSTREPGTVGITARSEGLESASVDLETQPIEETGGLTSHLPGDGLPVNLERGPTPAGPAYEDTRRPLSVATATAGSNPDDAGKAIDDNERSTWKSDEDPETAWIRFDLEASAAISEVKLKVAGHRTTSYPIRVAVDNREVWSGEVGRTLAYDSITFDPTEGRTLTIALEGVTSVEDAFGQIVEITGERHHSDREDAQNYLELMEVELYGPEP
ncbi:sugar-binding domain-containing protein [Halomontanus rarus]|uniref:sugar-binding domain-containing protein n=1 Tax=Halomontanus rarus TaxID=3034020 RepID=UPI001A97E342